MTKDEFLASIAEALDVQELSESQDLPEIDFSLILNLIDLYELQGIPLTAAALENVRNVSQLIDLAGKTIDA